MSTNFYHCAICKEFFDGKEIIIESGSLHCPHCGGPVSPAQAHIDYRGKKLPEMNFPTMNSRVRGIKKYSEERIEGMPLVINGEIAIVPENEIKQATIHKNKIEVTAYLIIPSTFQFIEPPENRKK
jgi:DNA-directed RNA polymerase subunit RPC12/RpoP